MTGVSIESYLRESFKSVCALIMAGQASGCLRAGDPARLYYALIGLGGTLFSVPTGLKLPTRRDVISLREQPRTVDLILTFVCT